MPPPLTTYPSLPLAVTEYLGVDRHLRTLLDARALRTALEIGLIDRLARAPEPLEPLEDLARALHLDRSGLQLLLSLLNSNRVITLTGTNVSLTPEFRSALRFRDLLDAKIDLATLVAPDLLDLFTPLLFDPDRFMRQARLFRLFDYRQCLEFTPEARASTQRWMRFTTALTRYESAACLACFDVSPFRRLLDIGGNSGEFALRLGQANPLLSASVLDLPLVCSIGQDHVRGAPASDRLRFLPGNALADPLPTGSDLITFKSLLHDWPDDAALQFLARAASALAPGGTLLIFERARLDPSAPPPAFGNLPILLFFRFYRAPDFYTQALARLGLSDIAIAHFHLEMPFFLITARRSS